MPDTGNAQVGAGEHAEAAAELDDHDDTKQDQVLQREGVENALMDQGSSEAGERIEGVEESEEDS